MSETNRSIEGRERVGRIGDGDIDMISVTSNTIEENSTGLFSDIDMLSVMSNIIEESGTGLFSDRNINAYEIVNTIDFGSVDGKQRTVNKVMTQVRGNKLKALCKIRMESEELVHQTVSRDKIGDTQDRIGEGASLDEETDLGFPNVEEDNMKHNESPVGGIQESCAVKFSNALHHLENVNKKASLYVKELPIVQNEELDQSKCKIAPGKDEKGIAPGQSKDENLYINPLEKEQSSYSTRKETTKENSSGESYGQQRNDLTKKIEEIRMRAAKNLQVSESDNQPQGTQQINHAHISPNIRQESGESKIVCDHREDSIDTRAESLKVEVNVDEEEIINETDETREELEDKKVCKDKLFFDMDLKSIPSYRAVKEAEIDNKAELNCEEKKRKEIGIEREEIFRKIQCKKINFGKEPTPLYQSIDTQHWKMAYEIIRRSPEEASTWVYCLEKETSEYEWIFLPIHVACFSGAPLDLMKKLVGACPQGVRMAAKDGKLPLHIACETLAQSKVITFLYNMYPDALYAIDNSGNTPIQETIFSESKSGRKRVMKLLTSLQATEGCNSDDESVIPTSKPAHRAKVSKFTFKKLRHPITIRRTTRSAI